MRDTATDPAATQAARRDLAVGYSRLGDMLASTGATSEALEQHRLRAQRHAERSRPWLPTIRPTFDNWAWRITSWATCSAIRTIRTWAITLAPWPRCSSPSPCSNARAHCYPDNAMFRRNLAVARSNVADILTALGRSKEAVLEEHRALETYEAQVREDPNNAAAKNDLAIAFIRLLRCSTPTGVRARRSRRSNARC